MRKTTIVVHAFAWSVSLIWIIPFLGVLMASIRPYEEVAGGWWNLTSFHPSLNSYLGAWNHLTAPLSRAMLNSALVAIPSTFLPILVAALAAYSFARFSFPLRDLLFLTIVILQTIPQQMVIIPIFMMMFNLGLWNTYLGLILVHSAFALPWQILFLRNFFSVLPVEIEEAARIDGASYLKIFYRIVLPMSLPALASVIALQFVWVWNDFFFALTLITEPTMKLATQAIPVMKGRYVIDWSLLSAASVLVMTVPVIIYAALQRYYIRGITTGAVKG
ncbi:MAG: carbohydrate ABC transporter permease [Candidatus Bathyarchaeia archaeon]